MTNEDGNAEQRQLAADGKGGGRISENLTPQIVDPLESTRNSYDQDRPISEIHNRGFEQICGAAESQSMSREEVLWDLLLEALLRGFDVRLGSHVRPPGGR